jgi:hypothetical protein
MKRSVMRARVRGSAAAALLAFTASLIAFGGTPGAVANDGDPMILGTFFDNSQTTTRLTMDETNPNLNNVGLGGLEVVHGPDSNDIRPIGVVGYTGGSGLPYPDVSLGLYGESGVDGIWGLGARNGVVGKTNNGAASGVYGENQGTGYGVAGRANTGTGVFADTQSGTSLLATAVGGTAVNASAGAGGTSIKTKAPNSGTALSVTGKAKFSRSGVVTIAAGTASEEVTLTGVNSNSMIIATAQQTSAVSVKAAVPASGSFTIYLTGNAPAMGLKVAYFVLN